MAKETPKISFPAAKKEEVKVSKKITVARPGSKEARAIVGKSSEKAVRSELNARIDSSPQVAQNRSAGFTTHTRTHGAPKYVNNSLSKGQTIRPSEEQIEKHNTEAAEVSKSHELPGGRKNAMFDKNPAAAKKAWEKHYGTTKGQAAGATSSSTSHGIAQAKGVELTHKFVSEGGKGPKAEAARAGFHALGIKNSKYGPCATAGCTRTTEGTSNCADGKCNTPKVDVQRPRG